MHSILIKLVPEKGESIVDDTHPPHVEAANVETYSIQALAESVKKAIERRIKMRRDTRFPSAAVVYLSIEWATPTSLAPTPLHDMNIEELQYQIEMIELRGFKDILVVDYVLTEKTSWDHRLDKRNGVLVDLFSPWDKPSSPSGSQTKNRAWDFGRDTSPSNGGEGSSESSERRSVEMNTSGRDSNGEEEPSGLLDGAENGDDPKEGGEWCSWSYTGNEKDGHDSWGTPQVYRSGWTSPPTARDDTGAEADDELQSKRSSGPSTVVGVGKKLNQSPNIPGHINCLPSSTPGTAWVLCEVEKVKNKSSTKPATAKDERSTAEVEEPEQHVPGSWGNSPTNGSEKERQREKSKSPSSSGDCGRSKKAAKQSDQSSRRRKSKSISPTTQIDGDNAIYALKNGSATVGRSKKAPTHAAALFAGHEFSAAENRIPSDQFIVRPLEAPNGVVGSSFLTMIPPQQMLPPQQMIEW